MLTNKLPLGHRALAALLLCLLPCSRLLAQQHTTIAFGSCNSQDEPQPLWPAVIAASPDLWVWLGDNIYGDTHNPDTLASKYNRQLQHPGYQALLKTTPVTGTWDDHDFGHNDATATYSQKTQSQQLFLDFMGVPANAPVRKQQGIYRTYTLVAGVEQKVKIFLLDTRYHLDPFRRLFGLYLPNYGGDVLGEAQWKWLEEELATSDAQINIIASSMQMLPTGYNYTSWAAFPNARKRLLRLLETTQPTNPILLSGDRHVGELAKITLQGYEQPVYEITSSGMTHHRTPSKGGNRYRVGEQIGALNFGVMHIAWGEAETKVTLQIRSKENLPLLEQALTFKLTPVAALREEK